jgi:septum site-determining protein MinC
MAAAVQPLTARPTVRFWNRSFLALVVAPELPASDWFSRLDAQIAGAPAFFRERPVVVDLSAVDRHAGPGAAAIVLEGLESRGLRLVAVEGVEPALLADGHWSRLAKALPGRDLVAPPGGPTPEIAPPSALLVEGPVRSGQTIVFEGGDVTVVGAISSGAEVVAGGSIHVYGALRGRAIAGLRAAGAARIFCQRLEAEQIGIDQLYRTAEHWGPILHGRPVQVRCDRGELRLSALA